MTLHVLSLVLIFVLDSDDKPNIWRMKKKERKDFRRQQEENYDLVHNLKQLYETIRRFVNLISIWEFKAVGELLDFNLRYSVYKAYLVKHQTAVQSRPDWSTLRVLK